MREGDSGYGPRDPNNGSLPPNGSGHLRLGDYLVERGYLSKGQLDAALEHQRVGQGTMLGDVLTQQGLLSEEALAQALADISGLPYRELRPSDVQAAALQALPRDIPARHSIVPVQIGNGTIVVACSDPFDILAIDEVERRTGLRAEAVCVTESDLQEAMEEHYGGSGALEGLVSESVDRQETERRQVATGAIVTATDLEATENEPIVRLVEEIINTGVRKRATDIHVEPEEEVLRIRYRVDGMLLQGPLLPRKLHQSVVSRIKVIAGLDIAEQRLPQEGHVTYQAPSQEIDLRVSCFPTVFGEKVAMRLLERKMLFGGLEDLGLGGDTLAKLRDSMSHTKGIVLLTGPTGSGKTTTLYTMLSNLDMRANNIVTLEDPVEYRIPEIRQSQINNKAGFTFSTGLRSVLRQDPDIILLGEIRDPETAGLALRAALTGILVFSTLHTNEAAGTFPRLVDMGLEPYLIGSTMISAVAERLVRKVCDACAVPVEPDRSLLERLGLGEQPTSGNWRRGRGCRRCGDTGYRGRTGIFEILMVSDEIREAIKNNADTQQVRAIARREGMETLMEHGLSRVRAGETTLEELARVARE